MTTRLALVAIFCSVALSAVAQHPLVGTWNMISVKGIDADGKRFFLDTTSVKETKIITPTHYMLIAWDVDGDSLIFNRTMAGKVRLEEEKYIEVPMQASVQIFENIKVDFTWKLEGDIFTQSGTIIRPDGKPVVLEALIFKRANNTESSNNPAVGAWSQVTSYYTTPGGARETTFSPPDKRLLIITPTHWMRIDHKEKKFHGVFYGTYTREDDKVVTMLDFTNHPFKKGARQQFNQKVKGDKLELISTGTIPDGKTATFYDILEKEK